MNLVFVNESKSSIPRAYLQKAVDGIFLELKKKKVISGRTKPDVTLVFLPQKKARKINLEFRGKDYATDVLSFESMEEGSLGELILCPEVLKKQAAQHGLSYRDELTYMILHGILHLLGFDHEVDPKEAEEMFRLQDAIFEKLLASRA